MEDNKEGEKFIIGRFIEGIALNGLEFLHDQDNNLISFNTKDEAIEFVKKEFSIEDDLDAEDMVFVKDEVY